jgi:hypothetical protein
MVAKLIESTGCRSTSYCGAAARCQHQAVLGTRECSVSTVWNRLYERRARGNGGPAEQPVKWRWGSGWERAERREHAWHDEVTLHSRPLRHCGAFLSMSPPTPLLAQQKWRFNGYSRCAARLNLLACLPVWVRHWVAGCTPRGGVSTIRALRASIRRELPVTWLAPLNLHAAGLGADRLLCFQHRRGSWRTHRHE